MLGDIYSIYPISFDGDNANETSNSENLVEHLLTKQDQSYCQNSR